MDIKSPDISNAGFSLAVWYGTVGGAALSVDASDPNASAPTTARILRITARHGTVFIHGNGTVRATAIGGTSCAVQTWFYDEVVAFWLKLNANPVTLTTATGLTQLATTGNMGGAKVFLQVTANTGVSAIGYDLI